MPLAPIRVIWIASLVLTVSVLFASPAFAQSRCSLKSLDGSYGVKFDGQSENLGRFASVSLWVFDGKGGLEASESFSSEATGPNTRTVTGSYQVEPTCAFRLLFPSTLGAPHDVVGDCVLVDSGKEFYCIDVEHGWVATGSESASTRPVDPNIPRRDHRRSFAKKAADRRREGTRPRVAPIHMNNQWLIAPQWNQQVRVAVIESNRF